METVVARLEILNYIQKVFLSLYGDRSSETLEILNYIQKVFLSLYGDCSSETLEILNYIQQVFLRLYGDCNRETGDTELHPAVCMETVVARLWRY